MPKLPKPTGLSGDWAWPRGLFIGIVPLPSQISTIHQTWGATFQLYCYCPPQHGRGRGRGGAARGGNQQQLAMNSNWISRPVWRLPARPPCIPVIAGEQRWWPGTALTITPPRHVGHVGRYYTYNTQRKHLLVPSHCRKWLLAVLHVDDLLKHSYKCAFKQVVFTSNQDTFLQNLHQ